MRTKLFYLVVSALVLTGCSKSDLGEATHNPDGNDKVKDNVEKVFGVTFDANHDWCTTASGQVTITGIPSGTTKVQLYALVSTDVKDDENQDAVVTSLLKLNEDDAVSSSQTTLVYDAPSLNKGIYAAIEYKGKLMMKLVNNGTANFATSNRAAAVRRAPSPTEEEFASMTLTEEVESYASKRGWLPGQMLYGMSDDAYQSWKATAEGYSEEYTQLFRNIIFSYFKNGKNYNNLPLIKESQYFNDKVYPVTTGEEAIVVSPVYKSDQATKYGNEVWNSDLYYYYFKDEDLNTYVENGGTAVDFLNNLPKYKAISFKQHFGETEDDVIDKRASYTLIYWGDGTPELGTTGKPFPVGYKIGFMVRAKATAEGGKKQGELYGDGRLNNEINNYDKCNFKSSITWSDGAMEVDGPRAGWINLEDKLFLCFESGTDADFNDVILEVEGGIEPIPFIPDFNYDFYTFCFEDREVGDYDMNDVVIKATRIDNTTVEYSIVACGAYDQLQIRNINGTKIRDDQEVHGLFGVSTETFINTVKNAKVYPVVTDRVKVDKNFSFLNEDTQLYIYNVTTGKTIKLSKKGEDPHGIMIPYDFKYPVEKMCIKDAFGRFNEWGQNRVNSTDWYKYFTSGTVYNEGE
jgi:hypothetical protein